ncbi:MAG: ABC transporter permease [Microbacterium sp.]|jgi:ABC-2 type transport system permease protein|uniref:ABC transporter permease n=1 Tax=Microbacterium ginsengisoli TaxID=400772 RepID=A0A0F0LTR6_9MICO|nr:MULTISPECIES: ABC transporter permease [Microbacterium]MAL06415.1 ABC transporter permease [Microbacterium sp.]MCK9917307.1 ABC transporter permease [Microbacteriaceae bacterium K1510]KJL36518.1 ABC-2 family transporter protein [Microbacterium ginsengisoli]MBN9207155.1 ABC transporter permease [Microbacterium ginsengisoli]HAN24055.1 ABC transporter permease [Microbacterium ginsengisoli]
MSLARATRSELTKLYSTAIWWILAIVLVVYVGFVSTFLGFVLSSSSTGSALSESSSEVPATLYSLASSIGYVFPLLIGTLIVTGEFRHKTLTPTFLATPARGTVLWAKLLASTTLGLLYGVLALLVTVGPIAGLLAAHGLPTGLGSSDTWALVGRILLVFVLWTWVGLGLGTLIRNQVAAIVVVLAFTQFIEPLLRLGTMFVSWLQDVGRFLPGAAADQLVGSSVLTLGQGGASPDPLTWYAAAIVLAAYAFALLLLGHIFSWRRDVA